MELMSNVESKETKTRKLDQILVNENKFLDKLFRFLSLCVRGKTINGFPSKTIANSILTSQRGKIAVRLSCETFCS